MSNAFLYRMGSGFPGHISRSGSVTLEANILDKAISFGTPVKLKNGKITPLEEGDTSDNVYGFLARQYPTTSISKSDEVLAVPKTINDVMRRGYMAIKLKKGQAEKGAPVYVRIKDSGTSKIGDIESALVDGETIKIPSCFFMGEGDKKSITEISYHI